MESELIEWLSTTFPFDPHDQVIGIGDDAAVLESSNRRVVLTSDAIIENVHFDKSMTLEQIGRKALAVNLSDLASMAAEPNSAIVNLCLPTLMSLNDVKRLYQGMLGLIEQFNLQIIGGDTNVGSSELIISVTAIGWETENGVLRLDSAKPGDRIVVSGTFGGSRSYKHFSFMPRCDLALHLNQHYQLSAATDVSDGLSLDLFRMAAASQVGFLIQEKDIPVSDTVDSGEPHKRLGQALSDGEDFELIFAVPASQVVQILDDEHFGHELCDIGEFNLAKGGHIMDLNGNTSELQPSGYLH